MDRWLTSTCTGRQELGFHSECNFAWVWYGALFCLGRASDAQPLAGHRERNAIQRI